ncbi:SGNH/GDSL hydrolase family protein [Cnuibacter physcomitrellae]|uniref:SGNH/GDSL hydrolase family protein n=1 Tax=Cnuibacter physcomitrellae TaxID=1619308 RepID=UPI002175CE60|nr:SGNH/GDSL hydrolase family protein [Cnuibacter physcomitrellae]MCS5499422.1 SGNH/GDSL hydrolase family protein [Cnuibacter physcomitrellae]
MTRRFGMMTMAAGSAALAVAALVAIPATANAAPQDTALAGLQYVALGDSYSAGYGLTPLTGEPVPGCAQAAVDYPHQLAAAYDLDLTDVTCAGAWATNMTTPQVTPAGTADPQVDALSADTDIVTVTLGGNDLGFADVAAACLALSPTGPVAGTNPSDPFQASNCESIFVQGGVDTLAQRLADVVVPDIAAGLAAIRAKAPNAQVFVVGYPAITPDAAHTPTGPAGCWTTPLDNLQPVPDSFPFTTTDVPYLHQIEDELDLAVQAQTAAAGAGFTYVPTFEATLAHSACAPADEQYVEGVTLASDLTSAVPGSLHPNATGVAFIAGQLAPLLEAAFPAPAPPAPTASPAPTSSAAALANTGSEPLLPLGLAAGALLLGGLAAASALRRRRVGR